MTKDHIKKYLPSDKTIREHKSLRLIARFFHDPNLWHLNRYSVATAFSIGLFCAMLPIPCQMIVAAVCAIFFQANLPLSVALVWVTNPVTMPAIFFGMYKLGSWILGDPIGQTAFHLDWQLIYDQAIAVMPALLLGSVICGLCLAVSSNLIVRGLWRYTTAKRWRARKHA